MTTAARRRVVLVGAGHVHLEVVRRFAEAPWPGVHATIVSLEERHFYSGMIPGYLAGQYSLDDLTADVPAIARRGGVECVIGEAAGLDPVERRVHLRDGRSLPYDLVSLNIGALLAGGNTAAARETERIKPVQRAAGLKERIGRVAAERPAAARAVIVGGGAAGVEVACAVAASLDRAGCRREVTVLESGGVILRGYDDRFRRRAERALATRGIAIRLGRSVAAVEDRCVRLDDGDELPSDLTVWLTGPEAAPLLVESGLPTDQRGFLLTDDSLRSVVDRRVFAVGDCGTMAHHRDIPKAGVYAVRQAPVLWRNLLASVRGEPLATYRPQSGFLSILNTCDGRALLRYKGLISWSRWAWWLKDWIDRRFMRKYQRLAG